ncbi:hypothetical protein [Rodentibacter sp. Ppn85]|uniref:hypothetical protein n=1 Tax=Rodentibacter sp. Ppn85 TaxID=1908525 RepID=UPI0013019BB7|nr:hypothetical protein [Rodentibacter sp. Ppn85]
MTKVNYQVVGYSQHKPIILGTVNTLAEALSLSEKALNEVIYQAVSIKKQGVSNG